LPNGRASRGGAALAARNVDESDGGNGRPLGGNGGAFAGRTSFGAGVSRRDRERVAGRDDAAADGFLRVALLAAANRNLAERATARAASAFERLGRRDEAETLRRDAERRFGAGR